mmetsp:Transcript_51190/g.136672  ORF Transcript_51190/g.136672 Transcript_51190/m.136672 type:complete len:223 (+) Transcript_51190:203-871(+)
MLRACRHVSFGAPVPGCASRTSGSVSGCAAGFTSGVLSGCTPGCGSEWASVRACAGAGEETSIGPGFLDTWVFSVVRHSKFQARNASSSSLFLAMSCVASACSASNFANSSLRASTDSAAVLSACSSRAIASASVFCFSTHSAWSFAASSTAAARSATPPAPAATMLSSPAWCFFRASASAWSTMELKALRSALLLENVMGRVELNEASRFSGTSRGWSVLK